MSPTESSLRRRHQWQEAAEIANEEQKGVVGEILIMLAASTRGHLTALARKVIICDPSPSSGNSCGSSRSSSSSSRSSSSTSCLSSRTCHCGVRGRNGSCYSRMVMMLMMPEEAILHNPTVAVNVVVGVVAIFVLLMT